VNFSIEDHSISGGPNDPACCNDNLSENEVTEISSCLTNHVQRFQRGIPGDVERTPAGSTERAREKEMKEARDD
jgi:hypothetical protein